MCEGDGAEVADGACLKRRLLCLCLLLAASFPAVATTAEVERALNAAEALQADGKFGEAVEVLKPYSASQNAEVEYSLAYSYMSDATVGRMEGEVDADGIKLAIDLAERSAVHGYAGGFNLLYMIFANGFGVPKDGAKAADYLRQGAKAGDSGARLNYAISLYEGTDFIARDRDRACPMMVELLKDESVQALIAHQVGLAMAYGHCGFKANPEAGMKTVEIAANRGVTGAERDMAMSYEKGFAGAVDPLKALEWYEKAASHGDGYSLWRLGMAYVEGTVRPKDSAKAVKYFQQSADVGSPNGTASLAVMYVTGDGVKLDYSKAMSLYERSAELGNAHAYREMAVMYMQGEGVDIDLSRAYSLYTKAIEAGDPEDPDLKRVLLDRMKAEGLLKAQ